MLKYNQYSKNSSPQQLLFFLHGYGANKDDSITFAPDFITYLPNAMCISPDAPQAFEEYDQNYQLSARQWFSLQDRSESKILDGLRSASRILEQFIRTKVQEHALSMDKVALLGFSQGAMLALHLGLRMEPGIKAIVSYSGYLVAPSILKREIRARPTSVLIHGVEDAVIEIKALDIAVKALNDNDVKAYAYKCAKLAHGIDSFGIKTGGEFLQRIFGDNVTDH